MAQAQNTRTFGATIGAALGTSAAYAVHGAISAAQYTGRFSQDVAAGASDAYGVKSAELLAKREQLAEQRGMVAIPVVVRTLETTPVVAEPVVAEPVVAEPVVAKQRRVAAAK